MEKEEFRERQRTTTEQPREKESMKVEKGENAGDGFEETREEAGAEGRVRDNPVAREGNGDAVEREEETKKGDEAEVEVVKV